MVILKTCIASFNQLMTEGYVYGSSYRYYHPPPPGFYFPVRYLHIRHSTALLSSSSSSASSSSTKDSNSSKPEDDFDFEANQKEEEQSYLREMRIRTFKKIFSTILFASTLGIAVFAHKRKKRILAENLKDCVRLPNNSNFEGSHQEFFRCAATVNNTEDGLSSSTSNNAPLGEPCVFPGVIVRDGTIKAVAKFPIRSDDIFVASFPKSGTTWVQEIVYLIKNDLDFKKAKKDVLEDRFPFLEYPYPGIKSIMKMDGPRLIKTHLPYNHLPKDVSKAKTIYILRNPKDVVVSFYHFSRMLTFANFGGRFEDFVDQFKKDELPYTPYFGHIESYLAHENDPNLLILSYEDLSRDPIENIRKISNFLEKPLSEEEINLLVEHTSFDEMKKNPSVNYEHWNSLGLSNPQETKFLRNGKVGDWKNYFSSKKNAEFDEWLLSKSKNQSNYYKFIYDLNSSS